MNTLALGPDEVHLWLAHYDRIDERRAFDEYGALLTADEHARHARFHFAHDRHRYLVTRALLRTTLSRYAAAAPADWRFVANAYGRPALDARHGSACELSFNLSHTRSLIALAVTRHSAVGVDVENVVARAAPIEIAARCFAPAEAAALDALEAERRALRFYEYWTFKESYIKARGMGLSIPLDKFAFSYPCDASVALSVDAALADDAARWRFWQLQPAPEYLLALCLERRSIEAPRVLVRHMLPAQAGDAQHAATPRRVSA